MAADLRNLKLLRETDAALQVEQRRGANRESTIAWVPKSQCDCIRRFPSDQAVDLTIPEWLADSKGFTY